MRDFDVTLEFHVGVSRLDRGASARWLAACIGKYMGNCMSYLRVPHRVIFSWGQCHSCHTETCRLYMTPLRTSSQYLGNVASVVDTEPAGLALLLHANKDSDILFLLTQAGRIRTYAVASSCLGGTCSSGPPGQSAVSTRSWGAAFDRPPFGPLRVFGEDGVVVMHSE